MHTCRAESALDGHSGFAHAVMMSVQTQCCGQCGIHAPLHGCTALPPGSVHAAKGKICLSVKISRRENISFLPDPFYGCEVCSSSRPTVHRRLPGHTAPRALPISVYVITARWPPRDGSLICYCSHFSAVVVSSAQGASTCNPAAVLITCRMRAHRNLNSINTVAAAWSQSPRLGTVQAMQTSLSPGIVAVTSATCLVSAVIRLCGARARALLSIG